MKVREHQQSYTRAEAVSLGAKIAEMRSPKKSKHVSAIFREIPA